MSNIKIIDGVYVNLDTVNYIEVQNYFDREDDDSEKVLKERALYFHCEGYGCRGKVSYRNEEEAKTRIKEILERQNNDEIEI